MKIYDNISVCNTFVTTLGESPYWNPETKSLVYVDMLGKKLFDFTPSTKEFKTWDMPDIIGCANPLNDTTCVIGIASGIYAFDMVNETYQELWKREDYTLPSVRFNDGKCDSKGNLWIGTTDVERNKVSSLYKFDNELKKYVSELIVSNGLAWTQDEKTMYHIDTWTQSIFAYDYDITTATISNQRIAFTLDSQFTKPDGMTIDNEGMLWIAMFGNSCVCRFNPNTGEQLAKINVPVKYPTTCVFGGDNMDILYIPSATGDDTSPMAGNLFSIQLPYHGTYPNKFKQ